MDKNALLQNVKKMFTTDNVQAVITSQTILLACGFTPGMVKALANHGYQQLPALIDQEVDAGRLDDTSFINKLFTLGQDDLDQLPISLYADLVQSEAFQALGPDAQNAIFSKIFTTLKIEGFTSLDKIPAERVAYNHASYQAILHAFFALNKQSDQELQENDQQVTQIIDTKLQAMLDKAPDLDKQMLALKAAPAPAKEPTEIVAAAETVLATFTDTQGISQANLQDLGLGKTFNQAAPNAKVVLAEYKLGAYAAAAQAKGLLSKADATRDYTLVPAETAVAAKDPAEKAAPQPSAVAQFVKAGKDALANFAKPQNLAKLGFRQVATKAVAHFVEGVIPNVGAAVGLAMKLGECGRKILKEKKSAKEVFQTAAPDLVRGVVTLGASFTPIAPLAGPLGTVASVAAKGIQAARAEGLKMGPAFLKRVAQEFKKKENLINLGASALGAAVGAGTKAIINHVQGAALATEAVSEAAPDDYTAQYLAAHPDAHLDANGWVQNADGSYARNEAGQLFGSADRTFRNLTADETLDAHGNIITKPDLNLVNEKVALTKNGHTYVVPVAEATAYQGQGYLIDDADKTKIAAYQASTTKSVPLPTREWTAEQEIADLQKQVQAVDQEIAASDQKIQALQELSDLQQQGLDEARQEIQSAQAGLAETNAALAQTESASVPLPARPAVADAVTETVADIDAEPEIAAAPTAPLTVRSQAALAEIEALAEKADFARDFNSLPEAQQQALINLKAQAIVAEEQGDTAAYQTLKATFDEKFADYVAADRELDHVAARANIAGTPEYYERAALADNLENNLLRETTDADWERFAAKYGVPTGVDKNGVPQYERTSGSLKMAVPDVPERNFAELGYTKQADGTWVLKDGATTRVVTDLNRDGIPDAGDTYKTVTEIGKPGSRFYTKQESQGELVDREPETVHPRRNAATELAFAVERERAKLNLRAPDRTL